MLEKAKTSATRKDEHGLARMVFEGVDLTPDDAAQMKRIKARVAIEETIRTMMAKGATGERVTEREVPPRQVSDTLAKSTPT